jgi:hypothetical protein
MAQYTALLCTEGDYRMSEVQDYVGRFVPDISAASNENSKGALAMVSASILSCVDAENARSRSRMLRLLFPDSAPFAKEVRQAFLDCLLLLQSQLKHEKPWEITEEFIAELGEKYVDLKTANSALRIFGLGL